ncbi:MAG: hypothetical protein WBD20_03330, partial [Pirellulaceae bacterium]
VVRTLRQQRRLHLPNRIARQEWRRRYRLDFPWPGSSHEAATVWSPGLSSAGTSVVGSVALETLVKATSWSVFV